MPQLMLFAPCQLSSVDKDSGLVSLSGLFTGLSISSSAYAQLKQEHPNPLEQVATQMSWSLVTVWRKMPEDEGVRYEQRIELYTPENQQTGLVGSTSFVFDDNKIHTLRANGDGFPISPEGEYTFRLFLKVADQDIWSEMASYPVDITHQRPS